MIPILLTVRHLTAKLLETYIIDAGNSVIHRALVASQCNTAVVVDSYTTPINKAQ